VSDTSPLVQALSDRYVIERELGQGGMATVYLAHDVKHDRKVAVKVLRPELAAVLGAERFLNEIKVTAGLSHPNILPLHDSGRVAEVQSGSSQEFLYYVMPCIEGVTLRDRINREKQLQVDDALKITEQIASALDYAHQRDVVHRDIKPENILFHVGVAMVADFGIALAVKSAGGERLTETGLSLGTPSYMSPEQIAGVREIDGRSDIYSLACVLYEMLAGETPFTGPNAQAIVARHMTDPVPPITTVRSSVPQPVAAAITKALGKAPIDRFESAKTFAEALLAESGDSEPEVNSIAVLPFANLSSNPDDEYLSDGIAEELIHSLGNVPGLRVIARSSSFALKGADKDVREVGATLGVHRVLEGSVRRSGERLRITVQLVDTRDGEHVWSERFDRASQDVFEIQDEIATAIRRKLAAESPSEEETQRMGGTENRDAYELYLRGRYSLGKFTDEATVYAMSCFEEAQQIDAEFALAYASYAEAQLLLCMGVGVLPKMDAMPKAKQAALEAMRVTPTIPELHTSLAVIAMHHDWDWNAAADGFNRSLAMNPNLASAYKWYGYYLAWIEGKYDESIDAFARAEELDPLGLDIRFLRGYTHYVAGDFDRALAEHRAILAIEPGFAQAHHGLGDVYSQTGKVEEAITEFERAIEIGGRATNAVSLLAYLYGKTGRAGEATELIAELEERYHQGCVAAMYIATGYAGLSDTEQMYRWLNLGLVERDPTMVYVLRTREFDAFRSDPQFDDLLEKIGFGKINGVD